MLNNTRNLLRPCTLQSGAVFLDRDGTLIEDKGYIADSSQVCFLPETIKALYMLQRHFLLFIVTHQPGIAEKALNVEQVKMVNDFIVSELFNAGICIIDVYVCPHAFLAGCDCIKPKPLFLNKAATRHGIDLTKSFVIGDHPHDVELAHNAGAKGIYVLTGHGHLHVDELNSDTVVVSNIGVAAERIISGRNHE